MRLGIWGWAALVSLVILALVGVAVRRPLLDALGREGSLGSPPAPRVRFEPVASGFLQPVDLQFVPGTSERAVVLEKGGRARLVALTGSGPASPGADVVVVEVHDRSELGLLGLAFHPNYINNGLFYLNTNPRDSGPLRTRISEWHLPADALGSTLARPTRVLLEIEQPFQNHDGGQLAFGPDGYLYIGMGDGGSRADPHGHGQNLATLLGSMLRIDVDASPGYAVPADNPFVTTPGARPEIWAYGLRNPWRFSFDPRGRLVVADVGQDMYEEVSLVARGDNLGWKVREGAHCFPPSETGCATRGLLDPVFEYGRDEGASITGGHVYLGSRLVWLRGKYVFADFVSGRVWALELPDRAGEPGQAEVLGRFPHAISAFGRAADGELYALDFAQGLVLRLDAIP